jgi:hypothetical protein
MLSSHRYQTVFASSIRISPIAEPQANVREFTVEEVEAMDLEALDYMYAAELSETIWEDIPGESPSESPDAPSDVWVRVVPNPGTGTITATAERRFNTNCPICHEDFATGQDTVHYRCGHVTCTVCYDTLIHSGWSNCTICRRSATRTRRGVVQNNDDSDDIGGLIVYLKEGKVFAVYDYENFCGWVL